MEKVEAPVATDAARVDSPSDELPPIDQIEKGFWDRLTPVIACGAGLFSDGYLNNVIGSVNTILSSYLYVERYAKSSAAQNVASISFAGNVVGILLFAYTSDHYSRKWSLLASTIILIIFAALAAGSYGAGGSIDGMFSALAAYRFFLGIGIGGEYPAGSVGCAETSGELKAGTRNRWFIAFTNVQIDFGFVVAAFVPLVLVWICGMGHLRLVWRLSLGLGVIPPLSLLWLRIKLKEPEEFRRQTMRNTKTPYWLAIKFYGYRLFMVSLIWFIYDFSTYSFGIYSSKIVNVVLGANQPLWKSFGWNVVINLFYMPGAVLGSFVSDWIGPRRALGYGVFAQAVVGFIMAGCYPHLATPHYVAAFVVVYGIFLSLGEVGPGDNIGLVASKTCATSIRGQYYGIAAAFGKIGAYVGTRTLSLIVKHDNGSKGYQIPFYISSSLCVLSAFFALFLLPEIKQDTITMEDVRFREYLESQGYDTTKMGVKELQGESLSSLDGGVLGSPELVAETEEGKKPGL
ncbi:MAG: hypothetical protein M1819_003382 [Sarea resinae]|nr:MAG: hypothetical protein M1819_003382 [Sarea resinae]